MIEDGRDRAFGERSLLSLREIKTHFCHYLILLLIISCGGAVFLTTSEKTVKFQAAALIGLGYIFWGIFHHLSEGNFNWKIMVEYTLIGLISIIFLGGVLL